MATPTPAFEQALATGRYAAVKTAPYFRSILARMRFIADESLPTAGTTAKGICYVNPAFIQSLNAKEIAFVLLHEASHLWLRHHERTAHYKADHGQANCAQDRAINPALLAMGLPAPKLDGKPCCLLPKDINAADNLAWEEYYTIQQAQSQSAPKSGQGQSDPNGKPQAGRGVANGQCGACSTGKAEPGQGDPADAPSDGEMERAAKAVSQAMVDAEKSKRGSVPGGFLKQAEANLTPPQIRWNTKLRNAVQATLRSKSLGGVHSTYNRISRRQWGIGYGPGLPILPVYTAPRPRVAVVLDTSGSMGRNDTARALSEIAAIIKLTECQFMACDAAVHAHKPVKHFKDLLPLLKGGGGSSFVPAFEALAKDAPDIVVFLTDGDISVPHTNPLPSTTKVFWAVIKQGGYGNTAPTKDYGVALQID